MNNKSESSFVAMSAVDGICLTSDGWSNVLGEPVINYCAVTPKSALFIEAVSTTTLSHTATFIANDIQRVIEKSPELKEKISGCCTDNTATNKAAWAKLKESYPDKFFMVASVMYCTFWCMISLSNLSECLG
jgi:hypothetical protein